MSEPRSQVLQRQASQLLRQLANVVQDLEAEGFTTTLISYGGRSLTLDPRGASISFVQVGRPKRLIPTA